MYVCVCVVYVYMYYIYMYTWTVYFGVVVSLLTPRLHSLIATSFSPSLHWKLPLFSPHRSASLFLPFSVFLVRIQVNFFRRHINHVGTGVCRMNSLRPGRVERMSTEIH